MKANELRIGNLLLTNNTLYRKSDVGKVSCVVAIDSEKSFEELKGVATIYHVDDEFKDTYGQFMRHLSPIPLTEEWLLKFGFEKDHNRFSLGDFKIERQGLNFAYVLWDESAPHLTTFIGHHQYVHQLQNLYFTLTSEELTIKEP